MGYTTKFKGQFDLDKLPPAEVIVRLNEIADDPDTAPNNPGSYCQWVLTKDCRHLVWDGNEKFYNYIEWLQYLMDEVLAPAGVAVTGSVSFQGESVGDNGLVTIEDGKAVARESALVADTLAELTAFKEFVLKSDYADEILDKWRNRRA